MGWLAVHSQSLPSMRGLGQPGIFEETLENLLERLVATQMPKDAPTGNLKLGLGQPPYFCLVRLGGVVLLLGFQYRGHRLRFRYARVVFVIIWV